MRRTDILDNPDREKTEKDLFEILHDVYDSGEIQLDVGTDPYDRSKSMIIVETWEDLANLGAILNGWEGGEIANIFSSEKLNEELDKAGAELQELQNSGSNNWRISNLRNKINKLSNLSAYKRWLYNNDYEEVSIEDFGVDIGFSDEYSVCPCCNSNIVRTNADSYSWTAPLYVDCEGYVCDDCVAEGHYDDYVLEEYKNIQKSIPEDFDLDRLGLTKVNDSSYQNGMHRGMDDSPQPIIDAFNEVDIDVWFRVYSSQFYIEFDVLVKEEDQEKAKILLDTIDTYQGFSNSDNLKKALKEACLKMSELPDGEGTKYAKCNTDGSCEARLVSNEEFINGVK